MFKFFGLLKIFGEIVDERFLIFLFGVFKLFELFVFNKLSTFFKLIFELLLLLFILLFKLLLLLLKFFIVSLFSIIIFSFFSLFSIIFFLLKSSSFFFISKLLFFTILNFSYSLTTITKHVTLSKLFLHIAAFIIKSTTFPHKTCKLSLNSLNTIQAQSKQSLLLN